MRFPILLSIRNNSSRLPGKCFVDVGGKRAVDRLIGRLRTAREVDGVVVATSLEPGDDALEDAARAAGVACFRGSAEDKLDRYAGAAAHLGAEFVVVVDGDDLLADPTQIDRIVATYRESVASREPLDYVIVDELPVGATGFGVRVAALREVLELRHEDDREVWGPYFTETGRFRVRLLEPDDPALRRPEIRLTLDYPEDLELIRNVFATLGDDAFELRDVIGYLDAHPEIAALNREAQLRYEANIARKSSPVVLG